jgi:hypothetical protein
MAAIKRQRAEITLGNDVGFLIQQGKPLVMRVEEFKFGIQLQELKTLGKDKEKRVSVHTVASKKFDTASLEALEKTFGSGGKKGVKETKMDATTSLYSSVRKDGENHARLTLSIGQPGGLKKTSITPRNTTPKKGKLSSLAERLAKLLYYHASEEGQNQENSDDPKEQEQFKERVKQVEELKNKFVARYKEAHPAENKSDDEIETILADKVKKRSDSLKERRSKPRTNKKGVAKQPADDNVDEGLLEGLIGSLSSASVNVKAKVPSKKASASLQDVRGPKQSTPVSAIKTTKQPVNLYF